MNRKNDSFGFGLESILRTQENKCFECGVLTSGLHHVVPVSRGGTKQLPLCRLCHMAAHGVSGDSFSSSLIKSGLEKAKLNGVRLGRAPIPTAVVAEAFRMRAAGHTYKRIAKHLGYSVGAVHNALNSFDANTAPHLLPDPM